MKFQGEEQGSEEKLEENFRIGKNRGPAWFRPLGALGWSLGQRNGGVPTWVDLAGIDPRDQTQGI